MASEYIGVNGVARKVPTHYIGVDGVARNVKSGYVGVDGVARKYFGVELLTGTFYLRPNADISIEHEYSASFAYLEINEEVNDSVTVILKGVGSKKNVTATSVFGMGFSGDELPRITRIIDAKVCGVGGHLKSEGDTVETRYIVSVNSNDILVEGVDLVSDVLSSVSSEAVASAINNYIKANSGAFPPIQIALTSILTTDPTSTKPSSWLQNSISQAYIELTCEYLG